MPRDSCHEEKSMLMPPTDTKDDKNCSVLTQHPRKWTGALKVFGILLLLQLLLLILNTIAFAQNYVYWRERGRNTCNSNEPIEAYSPAHSAVRYTSQRWDPRPGSSSFTGEPGPEVDEAWSRLLEPANVRIEENELREMNKSSLPLLDGAGYIGYLESHHMLHCVKRMYQFRHLDYYTGIEETQLSVHHWDHCVEILRQGIMCNADMSINTFEYGANGELHGNSRWPRRCVNFDDLQAWASKRMIRGDSSGSVGYALVPANKLEAL